MSRRRAGGALRVGACVRAIGAGFLFGLVLVAPAVAQQHDTVVTRCSEPLACTHDVQADAPVLRAGVTLDTGLQGRLPCRGWRIYGSTQVRRTVQMAVPAGTSTLTAIVDLHEVSRSGMGRKSTALLLSAGGDGIDAPRRTSSWAPAPGQNKLVVRLTAERPTTANVSVEFYADANFDCSRSDFPCVRPPLWPPGIPGGTVCPVPNTYGMASARLVGTISDIAVEAVED